MVGRLLRLPPPMSLANAMVAAMNAARAFQRREDYLPPQTQKDSPFRHFVVSCLKCGSVKLRIISEADSESGEMNVYLFCPNCRQREQLPVR